MPHVPQDTDLASRADSSRRMSLGLWLIVALAVLSVYVLSVWPMNWIARRGYLPPQVLRPLSTAYLPASVWLEMFPYGREFKIWSMGGLVPLIPELSIAVLGQ